MTGVVLSEFIRARRRGIILSWLGLTAAFTVLVNFVMFSVVSQDGTSTTDGPGVAFPTAQTLLSSDGIVAGLGTAASFFGVVTLAFWALAAAGDYSTGLVRILVAAEPRRWRLILGKWISLAAITAAVAAAATVLNVVVAPMAAQAGGYSPDAWTDGAASVAVSAYLHLYLSLLVWGTIGLALATVTKSAGIAIGIGVGYVLLVEAIIAAVAGDVADWLPGSVLTALAQGGNDTMSLAAASLIGTAYVAVALSVSFAVFQRRDITD
ncbi:ABC transporter permease subunit [Actinomycetes bacterium M1A6_2h]